MIDQKTEFFNAMMETDKKRSVKIVDEQLLGKEIKDRTIKLQIRERRNLRFEFLEQKRQRVELSESFDRLCQLDVPTVIGDGSLLLDWLRALSKGLRADVDETKIERFVTYLCSETQIVVFLLDLLHRVDPFDDVELASVSVAAAGVLLTCIDLFALAAVRASFVLPLVNLIQKTVQPDIVTTAAEALAKLCRYQNCCLAFEPVLVGLCSRFVTLGYLSCCSLVCMTVFHFDCSFAMETRIGIIQLCGALLTKSLDATTCCEALRVLKLATKRCWQHVREQLQIDRIIELLLWNRDVSKQLVELLMDFPSDVEDAQAVLVPALMSVFRSGHENAIIVMRLFAAVPRLALVNPSFLRDEVVHVFLSNYHSLPCARLAALSVMIQLCVEGQTELVREWLTVDSDVLDCLQGRDDMKEEEWEKVDNLVQFLTEGEEWETTMLF